MSYVELVTKEQLTKTFDVDDDGKFRYAGKTFSIKQKEAKVDVTYEREQVHKRRFCKSTNEKNEEDDESDETKSVYTIQIDGRKFTPAERKRLKMFARELFDATPVEMDDYSNEMTVECEERAESVHQIRDAIVEFLNMPKRFERKNKPQEPPLEEEEEEHGKRLVLNGPWIKMLTDGNPIRVHALKPQRRRKRTKAPVEPVVEASASASV